MAREQKYRDATVIAVALADNHGWSSEQADEFCIRDNGNRKRIQHLVSLGGDYDAIAREIHAGAVATGLKTR